MTMNLELIKVLNEHLTVLSQLAEQKVAVYREINMVNRAIQMEIGAYTESGVKVNLEYHAANNDVAVWDDVNEELIVAGTFIKVADVLQEIRRIGIEGTCKSLELTEIQVSNVLCLAARICENAVY